MMRRRSASVSASKTMISSIRLMNSGLKVRFTSPSTISDTFFSMTLDSDDWKPIPVFFWMKRAPMFDVMMMIVFLKFTRVPRPSVRWPSSNTCSRMLKMSGCAFSISSSSTTEYGFRFTFSVS